MLKKKQNLEKFIYAEVQRTKDTTEQIREKIKLIETELAENSAKLKR